ncbi:hypothetical protein ONS95_013661 [Cadophora gregata]|uniref:uncharacterized protein n=1 Tax=Cadophora gregata TaxID=51156 RepID=UPI0026DCCBCC|nr:uncharacterized protein ONS95_013661 [Cadophora gregata]KAK0114160.1 hypothetical protein ONS95_013661 [Cadophora gregata]
MLSDRRTTTPSTTTGGRRRKKGRSPSPPRRKTWGFKKEAGSAGRQEPQLKQDTFPVYHLRWENLKAYLESRFPDYRFSQRIVHGDYYHFDVPRLLTEDERAEILSLKDREDVPRVSQSPERDPRITAFRY